MLQLSKKQSLFLILCLTVYAALCLFFSESRTAHSIVGLTASAVLCLFLLLLQRRRFSSKIVHTVFLCSSLICIGINAWFLYSPSQTGYIDTFRAAGTPEKLLTTQSQSSVINSIDDDSLFRFDQFGVKARNNTAMHQGLYGTDYYFSVTSGAISRYFNEQRAYTVMEWMYNNLDGRTILDRLASVKYFITDKDQTQYLPYSYDTLVASNKKYDVYTTDTFLPFGYTYSHYIPFEEYETMTTAEKQQALLQGVVLKDSTLPEAEPVFSDIRPELSVTPDENVTIDGDTYTVTDRAQLTLTFDPVPNCETYLLLDDVTYDGGSTNFAFLASLDDVKKNIPVYTFRNSFYSGKDDFLCNLGYSEQSSGKITFTFPASGVYHIKDLYVVCQPMEKVDEMFKKLDNDTLENIVFSDNRVEGTIKLDSKKELVLSIPYSRGWTAEVDGQAVPLHQANTMYMGLELTPGEHTIQLHYVTPGLKIGLAASLLSLLFFLMLIIWHRRHSSQIS